MSADLTPTVTRLMTLLKPLDRINTVEIPGYQAERLNLIPEALKLIEDPHFDRSLSIFVRNDYLSEKALFDTVSFYNPTTALFARCAIGYEIHRLRAFIPTPRYSALIMESKLMFERHLASGGKHLPPLLGHLDKITNYVESSEVAAIVRKNLTSGVNLSSVMPATNASSQEIYESLMDTWNEKTEELWVSWRFFHD